MIPGQRSLHIDQALSNYSLGFANQPGVLIARDAMPLFPVPSLTGKFHTFNTKNSYRVEDDLVAPGGVASEIKWSTSTDTYSCEGRGRRRFVSDRDEANADPMVKPSRTAVRLLSQRILLKLESLVAAKFTSTYLTTGTTLAGPDQWSDGLNSEPLANFKTAQETCLIPPNVAVMNEQVYNTLRRHPKLLALYSYTGQGLLPENVLAEIMGVQRILVGRAKYDSADDAAAFSSAYVWGKHCTFAYIAPAPGEEIPTVGYTFYFSDPEISSIAPAAADGMMLPVRTYRDEATDRGGTWYEIDCDYITKVVTPLVAYHFTNAIA